MVWLTVIFGVIFAAIGIKRAFYHSWALLFNVLVAIYLGIMLTPTIIKLSPELRGQHLYYAGLVAVGAVLTFVILHTFTVCIITGKFELSLPRIFNTIGAAIAGFITGYCICAFFIFLICIMPQSKASFMGDFRDRSGFAVKSIRTTSSIVCTASLKCYDRSGNVINWLTHPPEPGEVKELADPTDVNQWPEELELDEEMDY